MEGPMIEMEGVMEMSEGPMLRREGVIGTKMSYNQIGRSHGRGGGSYG